MKDYLPLFAALVSLLTAIIVAFISTINSKKIERQKSKDNYYNFKLKQLVEEYNRYDPVFDFRNLDGKSHLQAIEEKFNQCRYFINRIKPLINKEIMREVDDIENRYNNIIRAQETALLQNSSRPSIKIEDYSNMLCRYVDLGHEIIAKEIENISVRFESD